MHFHSHFIRIIRLWIPPGTPYWPYIDLSLSFPLIKSQLLSGGETGPVDPTAAGPKLNRNPQFKNIHLLNTLTVLIKATI